MKILHTNMLRGWGGQSNRILVEARGAAKAGHEVAILAPDDAKLLERGEEAGLEAWRGYRIKPPAQFWNFLPDLRRFLRQFREWRPDLVHVHGSQDTWLVVIAKQILGKDSFPPLIRSKHNTWVWSDHRLNRWLYRQIDAYIAISGAIDKQLEVYPGISSKPRVTIHSVPDLERMRAAIGDRSFREELAPYVTGNTFLWGMNARMRWEKAQDVLLRAFVKVRKERKDTFLVLCGVGSELGKMKELARELGHGEDAVRFLEFRKDIPRVLAALDGYVHCSRSEGLGTAILEALAARKPVVATNVDGIPESVIHEKTGLLAAVDDPDALADAMIRLMEDKALQEKLIEGAQRHLARVFSEPVLVERTLKFYDEMMAKLGK